MKKIIALIFAAALVASLTACGTDETTTATDDTKDGTNPVAKSDLKGAVNGHVLNYKDYKIVLGSDVEPFLEAVGRPAEEDISVVESCAFLGKDYSYNFNDIVISTFSPDGTNNHILNIRLMNDNVETQEGATLYMNADEIIAKLGQPTEKGGTSGERFFYQKDGMHIEFLFEYNEDFDDEVAVEMYYKFDATAYEIEE
ncbi:MAG: hypothetical protein FWG45_06505 [Oscillospiraceae bacterium]|nr:hypothetical protein [Oscillospiraceae bacterium]